MKKPIIGIIGGTIWGNRGAESMLVTTIGSIREKHPDAIFKVFSYYPKKDRQLAEGIDYVDILSSKPQSLVFRHFPFAFLAGLLRVLGIRLPDAALPSLVKELRKCDVLLDIGGVTFMDGRLLHLPFNILSIYPAMLLGVPVVKLSQALGPFKNPVNRLLSRYFLSRCDHIFARGNITKGYLEDLGLHNFSEAPDLAFNFIPEYSFSKENDDLVDRLESCLIEIKQAGKKIITISPSSLVDQKSKKSDHGYVNFILDLVQKLDNPDTYFLFLPNSTTQGSKKLFNNDIHTVSILQQAAGNRLEEKLLEKIEWVTWDLNTRSLRRLMAPCSLVITSRFHSMISGLSLCIPTLVIGWSHKYNEALAGLNMEKYAADFSRIDSHLADLAAELLSNEQAIREQLAVRLKDTRITSARQIEYLEKFLV